MSARWQCPACGRKRFAVSGVDVRRCQKEGCEQISYMYHGVAYRISAGQWALVDSGIAEFITEGTILMAPRKDREFYMGKQW